MDRGELITDFGVPSSVGYYHLNSIGDMADTSTTYTEAPSYQPIPGMGMGTAAIFICAIIWFVVMLVTEPLSNLLKWFWRFWTSIAFAIVWILLLYAEREPRYIYPQEDALVKVDPLCHHFTCTTSP